MTNRVEHYEHTFSADEVFLAQHRSGGTGILPASVQLELAVVAVGGRASFAPVELTDVAFVRPVAVPDGGRATVALSVDAGRFELGTGGRVVSSGTGRTLDAGAPAAPPAVSGTSFPVDRLYAEWATNGLHYGPAFRTVTALTVADGAAEATVAGDDGHRWFGHPLLLDAVLQVVSVALQDLATGHPPRPMLPIGIARVALHGPCADGVTVRVRRTAVQGAYSVADAVLLDAGGRVVAELTGVRMRSLPGAARTSPLISRIRWTPAPSPATTPSGTWVVLHEGPLAPVAQALRDGGAHVVEVGRRSDHAALWDELTSDGATRLAGVVHGFGAGPQRAEADEFDAGLHDVLAALVTLAKRQRSGARFVVVTRGGQAVVDGDRPTPARAALWGLLRTAAIEYPGLSPRIVDVDAASVGSLAAELGEGPVEVALRDGVRYEPVREFVTEPAPGPHPVRRGGHYLVLGGHGGLGLAVAERLASAGAGSVALVSRSGGRDVDPAAVAAITAHGCAVDHRAADVNTPGGLREVVASIRAERGALHGVLHAAGTLRDGLLRTATREDVAAVLAPKVDGVRELAAAVEGLELDFAVLFGSVSGAFGNLGQGGYAAANAYLDAVAHAAGAPWVSIDWGLWGEIGMGVAVAEQLRRRGVRPLGTVEALDAMITVLRLGERQLVVAHPDGEPGGETAAPAPVPAAPTAAPPPAAPDGGVPGPAGSEEAVRAALTAFLAARLGVERIDGDAPLTDFGVDSIMSVELAEELTRRWGTSLPATLFLEYADVDELTEALVRRYGAAPPSPVTAPVPAPTAVPAAPEADPRPAFAGSVAMALAPDATPVPAAPPVPDAGAPADGRSAPARDDRAGAVAVVAVSGDLPGAEDLDGFWAMLRAGGHAFTDVPAERFDVDAHVQERSVDMTGTYCRSGAFVDQVDRLDPRFFGLSVREVQDMDPQQKLLLEHSWSVLQEGGMAGRRDVGVWVGATYTHHRDAAGLDTVGPHTALGSMNAVLANRISYTLDLTGPSQTVDTLCSSSLVALAQAMTALRTGQCGAAIVAACHVGLTPWYYRSLSQLGALSATRPRPFDARADGFVPGEGAVAVLLKPLADAERDGDRIWGVLRGAAVNHGGRGSALPVPRSEAQVAVVRAALADAGLAPADVSLIETHGTATRLGDPIEVAALTEVFGGDPARTEPVRLGSVKANIGHLEPASGLAGLIKVLLCLEHGEVPGLAGYAEPSAHVDLSSGTFTVPTAPVPWRSDGPRRAGISAFGMGGTNAHVVVEEHLATGPGPSEGADDEGEHLLLLSAHTPEALARRVADVAALVGAGTDVRALCASAATGRQHLAHRVAVLGADAAELAVGLRHAVAGSVVRGDRVVAADGLAARFVAGEKVVAPAGFRSPGGRLTLPPYPFRAPAVPDTESAQRTVIGAHVVLGQETVPAALLVVLGLAQAPVLEDVAFTARGAGPGSVTADRSGRTVTFRHRDRAIGHLTLGGPAPAAPPAESADALARACPRELDPDGLYAWFSTRDMEYAAPLRPVTAVRFGPDAVVAGLVLTGDRVTRAVAAVDAALQAMAVLTLADPAAPGSTLLPVAAERVVAFGDPADAALVHLRADPPAADGARRGRMSLLGSDGRVLLTLDGVRFRPVPAEIAAEPTAAPAAPAGPAFTEAALVELVRAVLRDPSVTATGSLAAAGLDSMLATLVAAEVNRLHGAAITPMDVLDARDCRALHPVVVETLPQQAPADERAVAEAALVRAVEEAVAPALSDGGRDRDMAVIGLSCALPGAADADGLWSLLCEGGSGVGPAPEFRWDGRGGPPPVGGFLHDIEEFDARFFDFFPKQAEVLDPQARWLLRTAWEALESAGIAPTAAPRRTGVFVGASYQHYREYNVERELDAHSGLGNHNAFLANRISYFLDLRGPSMTIDTLCSSSLVALHTAVRSLRDGECDTAIVSGVRLAVSPLHYTAMRNLRALSPTGASRAFDNDADGFVPGEGVITLVLKPLRAAQADHDRIHAVIKGTAVNHGGRTNGLTVPNSTAQHDVITDALRDADVHPDSISMLEAHGTGTPLGDPIEIDGLTRAWRHHTDRTQYCAIGSVKTNIGHLEPAAGLAGLAKVLLALRHDTIPPTLHVDRPNDHIRFEETPFYPAAAPVPWRRNGSPRRAAVSAFGMGGVNAHVVVEEPPAPAPRPPVTGHDHVLRVSAATEEGVRALALAYAVRLAGSSGDTETADLVHTANVGRAVLEFQTAVHGRSADALAAELRAVADGIVPVARVDRELAADPHANVVAAVRSGYAHVDWAALSAPGARTTDLPTHPFARDRHWNHAPTHPGGRDVPAPAPPVPATALRVVWEPGAAPDAAPVAGAVRVLARSAGAAERVSAALLAAGVPVAADGTGGLVAVPDLDRPHDAGPSAGEFWTQLRDLASALPPGAAVVWAEHRSVAVDDSERAGLDPAAAARTAAVRAAGAEGKLRVATLDLDPADPAELRIRQVVAELRTADGATAYRRGTRLRSRTVPLPAGAPVTVDGDGFHLVTGGLGAVGRELVAQLAASGARAIGIVGRSAGGELPSGLAAELAYLQADVTDPAALAAVVAEFGRRWGRLRTVVHCSGGVNPFGAVRRRGFADAERVLAPKVAGSENVVRLARDHGADAVVLVSSIAGALPEAGPGVVDYAMANAHQLALAQREHGPATAVTAHAWPNWSGTGMAADAGFAAGHSLTPDAARAAFAAHLVAGGAVILPGGAAPDPVVAAPPVPDAAAPAPVVPPAAAPAPVVPAPIVTAPVVPGTAGAGPDADTVARGVRQAFLDVLGEDPGDAEMARLGLDSVTIAELTAAVERRVGRSTDPAVLMRARTVGDIVAALAGPAAPVPAPRAAEPAAATASLSSLLMTLIDPTTDGSH